jgi:hypothetical protein
VAAQYGPQLVGNPVPQPSLEQYWSASKCRLDRWGRVLKRLSESLGPAGHQEGRDSLGALEEIVTGEVLARVWAAVLTAHDRHTSEDAGTVARTILAGQQEARNRALSLLVNGPSVEPRAALRLNRLRRRAECWTDLLVGQLSTTEDLTEFAAEPVRAREFAADFREQASQAWPLLFASLRTSFVPSFDFTSPNADLNAEIASGVISCFAREAFDSTGLLHSMWMARLQRASQETQCMIDALFAEELPARSTPDATIANDREFFRRRFSR